MKMGWLRRRRRSSSKKEKKRTTRYFYLLRLVLFPLVPPPSTSQANQHTVCWKIMNLVLCMYYSGRTVSTFVTVTPDTCPNFSWYTATNDYLLTQLWLSIYWSLSLGVVSFDAFVCPRSTINLFVSFSFLNTFYYCGGGEGGGEGCLCE